MIVAVSSIHDRIPDSLRKGSMCQPGDECRNGQCMTNTWERAFRATLRGRVDACIISGSEQCSGGALSKAKSNTQHYTTIECKSAANEPSSSAADNDSSPMGRPCEKCHQKSIVLYRRKDLLLCKSCS